MIFIQSICYTCIYKGFFITLAIFLPRIFLTSTNVIPGVKSVTNIIVRLGLHLQQVVMYKCIHFEFLYKHQNFNQKSYANNCSSKCNGMYVLTRRSETFFLFNLYAPLDISLRRTPYRVLQSQGFNMGFNGTLVYFASGKWLFTKFKYCMYLIIYI